MSTPHPLRPSQSETLEWQTRVDLAALYRLFVRYGWTDLIYTHISARVPGEDSHYLINPFGPMFDEMTASMLLKVSLDGALLEPADYPYNEAGHLIHSAVLKARPDINFVLHSHSRAGAAVSAMRRGLLPLSQHANVLLNTLSYHPYVDVTTEKEGCARLAADLGPDNYLMVMHNHGLLACGRTAAEAFWYLYYLEMACKIQVDVLASGEETIQPDDAAIASLASYGVPGPERKGEAAWPSLMRMLDKIDPSFRQ